MDNLKLEQNLGFLIHDVARLMRTAFDREMLPLGLTRSQWWLLAHLRRRNGMSQTDLAEELDLGKVTLGGLLDRLETKGWLTRQADPHDRRAKRIFLTPKSESVLVDMTSASTRLLCEVTEGIVTQDLEHLMATLMALKTRLIQININY
jgi:DNA-binding MarR family transcriptional regulator